MHEIHVDHRQKTQRLQGLEHKGAAPLRWVFST